MKIFLVTLLFFFALVIPAFAVNDANTTIDIVDLDSTPSSFYPTSLIFHTSERGVRSKILLTISWQDGNIDIKYGDNVTKAAAAEEFFEFLKTYIGEGYEIIPRGKP